MTPAWQDARDILCVRPGGLGGVLRCTPALRALRAALPGRRLTLLSSPSGAAAAPFIPDVDAVIACPAPWLDDGAHAAALAARLAARRFDAAVIFTGYTQSPLPAARLCKLAAIVLRLAHCRDNPDALLSDAVPDPEPARMVRHDVQRQLALVRQVGCRTAQLALSFALRAADLAGARHQLRHAGLAEGRPYLLLHPGAGAPAHRYPAPLWAEAARALAQSTGLALVFAGSAAEAGLVESIRAGCGLPSHTLAGRLGLGQLGAIVRMATVMVASNSGPAHIAAALGTPLVQLYALTHPQHTPWKVRNRVLFHDVACRFCGASACPAAHHACLAEVAPRRVVDAVLGLLQPAPRLAGMTAIAHGFDA